MKIKALIASLILGASLFGQTTTYTGTVKDLSGAVVTSGNVTFTLTPSVDTTISGTSRFTPSTVNCTLNGSGALVANDGVSACVVTQNTALVPTGTSYTICIQPYFTSPGSCFVDYAVTSSKDISTVAPTPQLSPQYQLLTTSFTCVSSTAVKCASDFAGDVCAQISAAAAALPAQGGVVDARNFSGDQTCTSGTLTLGSTSKSVALLLGNYRIISASTPVITVPGSSAIYGGDSLGGVGHSSVICTTSGGTSILWTGSYGGGKRFFIGTPGGAGRGLYLQGSGTNSVQFNDFEDIQINGPGGGVAGSQCVRLEAATSTSLVSRNHFKNLHAHDCAADFSLASSNTVGPTDNTCESCWFQAFGSPAGTGVACSNGSVNYFPGGISENLAVAADFENGASCAFNSFTGNRMESSTNLIIDNGLGTEFDAHSLDAATITGTDPKRRLLGVCNTTSCPQYFGAGPFSMGGESDPLSNVVLFIRPLTFLQGTGANQTGIQVAPVTGSDATATATGVLARADTPAVAMTQVNNLSFGAADASKGAGSAITNSYGFYAYARSSGANNFGFFSETGNIDSFATLRARTSFSLGSTLLNSATAPTITSGFGTSPTVTSNGTAIIQVNVGTGGVASSGTITMPTAAAHGWACSVNNINAAVGNRADNTVQISFTTTNVTVQNQTKSTGVGAAWTASDVILMNCGAF